MAARATEFAEAELATLLDGAMHQAREEQAGELERLSALAAVNPNIRAEEIEYRRTSAEALLTYLGNTQIKLDAVRVGIAT